MRDIKHHGIDFLYFSTNKVPSYSQKNVTAKEVQAAIKDGSIIQEMLNGEISRINKREKEKRNWTRIEYSYRFTRQSVHS